MYDAFHLGRGGYCDASAQTCVIDGVLRYDDETLAWHGDSPDYFYLQLPKINEQITRIVRRIMPESCKNFMFEAETLYKIYKHGAAYKIHKDGIIESPDSTFEDMVGVL